MQSRRRLYYRELIRKVRRAALSRASANARAEERWLAANKSNLRFCNSNCLGYADATLASSPSRPPPSLAARPFARAALRRGETERERERHPRANSFAPDSIPDFNACPTDKRKRIYARHRSGRMRLAKCDERRSWGFSYDAPSE